MKYSILIIFIFIIAASHAQNNSYSAKWDNGYKIESLDNKFKFKFDGRIMYDMATFNQAESLNSEFGEISNASELRRVRLFNSGSIYGNVKYKLSVEFSGAKVSIKDAYLQLDEIPLIGAKLRIGHFKEPFRLEVLTGSKYLVFMERSPILSFSRVRNAGFMFFDEILDNRLAWQIGVFQNAIVGNGNDLNAENRVNLTARVSGLLMTNEDRSKLVHLGAAFSHRSPKDEAFDTSFRPASHLAPKYLKISLSDANSLNLGNIEFAAIFGPLSLQSEFILAAVNHDSYEDNRTANSYYFQLGYFVTGEHRQYKNSYDGFSRIKPKNNYGEGKWGALELGIKIERLELGDLANEQLTDMVFGVNWYLNPATRIMTNFVIANISKTSYIEDMRTNILQARFQVDF